MHTFALGNVDLAVLVQNLGGVGAPAGTLSSVLFAVDDDSCVYFADKNPYNVPIVDIYVCDVSGAITWYQIRNSVSLNNYIANIQSFGNGNFFLSMESGQTFFVRVKNLKLNNASPVLIPSSPVPLANSCYAQNLSSIYYDARRSLLAAAWYEPVGQYGTNIYSSIYTVNPAGALNRIVDGYTSYACKGCDPPVANTYDQTGASLPQGNWYPSLIISQGMMSNGTNSTLFQYNTIVDGAHHSYIGLGGFSPEITVGQTGADCASSNFNAVKNRSAFFLITSGWADGYNHIIDSNVPDMYGTVGIEVETITEISDGVNAFTFQPVAPVGANLHSNGVLTSKYFFLVGTTAINDVSVPAILYAKNPGVFSGTSVHRRAFFTVNNTRAISPNGRFVS